MNKRELVALLDRAIVWQTELRNGLEGDDNPQIREDCGWSGSLKHCMQSDMEKNMDKWNPRYVAYAHAHDHTPETMLEHDRKRFRGGSMCGFMEFISEMFQKFKKAHPEHCMGYAVVNHDAFTAFIWDAV